MKFSIITINYNSSEATIEAVASLKKALSDCSFEYEIVVVDNNSSKDDVVRLESITGIRLIKNSENGGFAAANNIGIKAANGEFVIFLNNDTTIKEDIFTPLIAFMEANSEVGMVSPKIVYDREPYRIQFGGYEQRDRFLFDIKSTLHGKLMDEVEDVAQKCSFAHGAAMMLRRDVALQVGGMREDYFLYFEEIDFSIQVTRAGYEIWYYPFSVVYHNASYTTSRSNELKIYYNSRNRLFLAKNNLKGMDRIAAIAIQLLFSTPKNILKLLLKGRFSESKAYFVGVSDFVRCRRGKKI